MDSLPEAKVHRDWFADARGDGRQLQVTWHPEHRLVVMSLWQDDRCTSSFRLPIEDADRMISMLATSLGQAAAVEPRPSERSPEPVAHVRPEAAASSDRSDIADKIT